MVDSKGPFIKQSLQASQFHIKVSCCKWNCTRAFIALSNCMQRG